MLRARALLAVVATALATGACGDTQPQPTAVSGTVDLERPASGPPDAGSRTGHGNDVAVATTEGPSIEIRGTVRPPDSDVAVRDERGRIRAHARVDAGGRFVVELDRLRPGLNRLRLEAGKRGLEPWRVELHITRRVSTAGGASPTPAAIFGAAPSRQRVPVPLIRDVDGGTGRIRVSVEYESRCPERREHFVYFPPSQIVRVRIAPGVEASTQRTRTARIRLPRHCRSAGKVFAEATNASGLESFSDPIWFEYRRH